MLFLAASYLYRGKTHVMQIEQRRVAEEDFLHQCTLHGPGALYTDLTLGF